MANAIINPASGSSTSIGAFAGLNTTDPHLAFWLFAGELAGILVLTIVADASDSAGYVILVVFAALWLLWLIFNSDKLVTVANKITGG